VKLFVLPVRSCSAVVIILVKPGKMKFIIETEREEDREISVKVSLNIGMLWESGILIVNIIS
jgi:hypothetical protein